MPRSALSVPRRLNSFLDSVDVGDLIVKGDLEAYSCERRLPTAHTAAVPHAAPRAAAHALSVPHTEPAGPAPTCAGKLAGLDKKLSRSLEEEVAAGSASPSSLSKSPVGPLHESSRCV